MVRPLPTHRTTQIQNKRIQTSMPPVGFKPTISVLKPANTAHVLDCVATVISFHLAVINSESNTGQLGIFPWPVNPHLC
jgi:hypothetical protein